MEIMEKERMIQDNMKLFCKYAYEYMRKIKIPDYEFDDYLQVILLDAWRFLDEYDSNKGALSTFIHFKVSGRFKDIYKRDKKLYKYNTVTSLDVTLENRTSHSDKEMSIYDSIEDISNKADESIVYYIDIYKNLKETIKPEYIEIYEKSKSMNTIECGKWIGKSQSCISKVIAYVDLCILKEYGYILNKNDLDLIDFNVSNSDKIHVDRWKKSKFEELKLNTQNTYIYKKLLQKKYHI